MTTSSKPKSSWRDVLPIHPAADLFPLMSADELKTLGADIRKQGQRVAIAVWKAQKHSRPVLLDGRNRLDAMEAVGIAIRVDYEGTDLDPRVRLFKHMPPDGPWWPIEIAELSGLDPYDVVLSANIHRRHLTAEQKRDLIERVMKATPEKSNRQIAEVVKVDHKTVAAVRAEKEATGEIPQLKKTIGKDGKARKTLEQTGNVSNLDTRTDSKGRQQPAHKAPGTTCGLPDPTPLAFAVIAEAIVGVMNPFDAKGRYELIAKVRKLLDEIEENTRLHEEPPKAISPAATKVKPHQPDELSDIPKFLRRQPS